MEKIDKRKSYYLLLDTEATNIFQGENGIDFNSGLVYDIGMVIIDKKGTVYETASFLINEIFKQGELMKSAYYANKLPLYDDYIKSNKIKIVNFFIARQTIFNLVEKYNIKAVIAHNMKFDHSVLNATQRYLTKSKYRFFLPYGLPLWDTMKMAESTICKQKMYKVFCEENGYITKNGRVRKTAEILYQYINGLNVNFKEEHTGLSDAMIEKEIFAHCMKQNKKMKKLAYNPK